MRGASHREQDKKKEVSNHDPMDPRITILGDSQVKAEHVWLVDADFFYDDMYPDTRTNEYMNFLSYHNGKVILEWKYDFMELHDSTSMKLK